MYPVGGELSRAGDFGMVLRHLLIESTTVYEKLHKSSSTKKRKTIKRKQQKVWEKQKEKTPTKKKKKTERENTIPNHDYHHYRIYMIFCFVNGEHCRR